MEPLPVGSIVLYHGKRYVVTAHQNLTGLFTQAELGEIDRDHGGLNSQYPDGVAYELWQEGVLRKFGNRAYSYYRVRRESFTNTGERENLTAVTEAVYTDDNGHDVPVITLYDGEGNRVSATGPCITHGDPGHPKCRVHECCIGQHATTCRAL